ncbi:unnamed protein product, partial [Prorocentrum cordatum]
GPNLTIQERAQVCRARIKQLEEALGVEVGKLDTCQSWVRIRTEGVKKLELALAEADGECALIVSELADKIGKGAEGGKQLQVSKAPLADVALEERKDQLRLQMQTATKDMLRDAMVEVEKVKVLAALALRAPLNASLQVKPGKAPGQPRQPRAARQQPAARAKGSADSEDI